MVKRLFLGLVTIFFMSCHPGTYLTSDSEAYMQYNRAQGNWEIIWTWKLKGGRQKTDTIKVVNEEKIFNAHFPPEESGD